MRIRWHGLEFVGDDGPATYSIEPNGLSGVLDGVGSRGDRSERPFADGEFDSPTFLTANAGSISGLIETSSSTEYVHAIRRLTSIPVRELAPMTVQVDGSSMVCRARRHGDVDVTPLVFGRVARYMVQFFAPNPRWLGETHTFTGSNVEVLQYGNFPAIPSIEVVGPVTAPYSVSSQGHTVTVTQSLAAGQRHRFDMSSGWVYRDGVLQSGVLASADVFTVPPGRPVVVSGPSSMVVRVPDTFI